LDHTFTAVTALSKGPVVAFNRCVTVAKYTGASVALVLAGSTSRAITHALERHVLVTRLTLGR
jgi:predicted RNA polymerase sigma factor